MQLNLSNCASAVTVIYRNSSGSSFRLNHVLDIGVKWPSKLQINIWNKFLSTTEKGFYDYTEWERIPSLHFNCLYDFGTYIFPKCTNACMIPFNWVAILSNTTSFRTVTLWKTVLVLFFFVPNNLGCTWGCGLVIWLCRFDLVLPSIVLLKTPNFYIKSKKRLF